MDKYNNKLNQYHWEGEHILEGYTTGEIQAINPTQVKIQLKKRGIVAKKIRLKRTSLLNKLRFNQISTKDISFFYRQLSTLLNAGIPLIQSLEIIIKSTSNLKLQSLVTEIKENIQAGNQLSQALKNHPKFFNPLFCNLIYTGEQSGSCDKMISRLADYQEKMDFFKAKIKKALAYPMLVFLISILITIGLLLFIVPKFQEIYSNFGTRLPAMTLVVIALSDFIRIYISLAIGIIIGFYLYARNLYRHKPTYRYKIDKIKLKLPIIGKIFQYSYLARLTRTLSITLAAGLPLSESLLMVASTIGNIVYYNACLEINKSILSGEQMNRCMSKMKLFPPIISQMISVGEESGSLEFMLTKLADCFEAQMDYTIDNLSSLLEPVIMVILGIMIGGLIIAMYLPIFNLGSIF